MQDQSTKTEADLSAIQKKEKEAEEKAKLDAQRIIDLTKERDDFKKLLDAAKVKGDQDAKQKTDEITKLKNDVAALQKQK